MNEQMQFNSFGEFLNRLRIFFYAVVLVPLLLFLVLFFMHKEGNLHPINSAMGEGVLLWVIQILCLVLCALAYGIYQVQLKKIRLLPSLKEKFQQLFLANVFKFALLEGANMIAVIFFWLTANTLYLILMAATLILFLMSNPSTYSICGDLQVSKEEKAIIDENKKLE